MNQIEQRAIGCRAFENLVYRKIQEGSIKFPVYLSAGQEYIAATLSVLCEKRMPAIFPQHRCHSTYLAFGGDICGLMLELMGKVGCSNGMGGSASIGSPLAIIKNHDGFMGSNAPIGTGYCYAKREPTIVFLGDAAAEEGYALSAFGWASTHNLPILFVVEDNGLSILTQKKVRRSWHISDVANAMGLEAYDIDDDPDDIINVSDNFFRVPMLLNINTKRKYWHAGAGSDGYVSDRLAKFAPEIQEKEKVLESLWSQLEKQ